MTFNGKGEGSMTTLRALIAAALVVGMFGMAVAKLPPPAPLTDAQKAAADEKKAKDAAAADAAKAQQAKAEDRVAVPLFRRYEGEGQDRLASARVAGRRGTGRLRPRQPRRRHRRNSVCLMFATMRGLQGPRSRFCRRHRDEILKAARANSKRA